MAPTLSYLPHELVLGTLEAVHDSQDLLSLILTAQIFASIWKSHAAPISRAVLGRSIESYNSARELDHTSTLAFATAFEEIGQQHRRIVAAASCVEALSQLFFTEYSKGKLFSTQVGVSNSIFRSSLGSLCKAVLFCELGRTIEMAILIHP